MRAWRCFAGHLNDGGIQAMPDHYPYRYGGYCSQCLRHVPVTQQFLLTPL